MIDPNSTSYRSIKTEDEEVSEVVPPYTMAQEEAVMVEDINAPPAVGAVV